MRDTATTKLVKKALIRDSGYPAGEPAPMYLVCFCGKVMHIAKPFDRDFETACTVCGKVFDGAGYVCEE